MKRISCRLSPGKRTFLNILLSYLVIALIPQIIAFVGFDLLVNTVREHTYQNNMALLSQFEAMLETRLSEEENTASKLAADRSLLEFSQSDILFSGDGSIETLQELQTRLQIYSNTSDFVQKIYLVFPNSRVSLLNNSVFLDPQRLYNSFFSAQGLSLEEWEELVCAPQTFPPYSTGTFSFLNAFEQQETCQMLMYAQDIYWDGKFAAKALYFIPFENIDALVQAHSLSQDDGVLICNVEGEALYRSPTLQETPVETFSTLSGEGFSVIPGKQGQEMVVCYLTSETNGWRYYSVIPSNILLAETNRIRFFVQFFSVLSSLALLIGVVFLSYRKFLPVQTLSLLLGNTAENAAYPHIQRAISSIQHLNEDMKDEIEKYRTELRQSVWRDLFHHPPCQKEETVERCLQSNITVNAPYLNLCFYVESTENESFSPQDLLGILSGLPVRQRVTLCYQEYNAHKGILLFEVSDREGRETAAAAIANGLRDFFSGASHANLYAAAVCFDHVFSLYSQYQTCESALQTAVIEKSSDLLWGKSDTPSPHRYVFSLRYVNQLLADLRHGDDKAALALYEDLFRQYTEKCTGSVLIQRYFLNDLKSNSLKILYDLCKDLHLEESRYTEFLTTLEYSQDADVIFNAVRRWIPILCADVKQLHQEKNPTLELAIQYVEQNFSNPQITLSSVAERFHFSDAYFSSLFKKYTGYTFSTFLELKRIQYASSLLHSNLKIKEIAAMSGYNNDISFRNAFKRITGKNPGEYKKQLLLSENEK